MNDLGWLEGPNAALIGRSALNSGWLAVWRYEMNRLGRVVCERGAPGQHANDE